MCLVFIDQVIDKILDGTRLTCWIRALRACAPPMPIHFSILKP